MTPDLFHQVLRALHIHGVHDHVRSQLSFLALMIYQSAVSGHGVRTFWDIGSVKKGQLSPGKGGGGGGGHRCNVYHVIDEVSHHNWRSTSHTYSTKTLHA